MLAYIDDVYVNESIMSAEHVRAKLAKYRLMCKDPECLKYWACILRLEVWQEYNTLHARKCNPNCPLCHGCGKLVEYLPMCGWLHVVTRFMKRQANDGMTKLITSPSSRW